MDEVFSPWLDPILDNIERWPNLLIMDSLLNLAGNRVDNAPPPKTIIRALDGLEKLALARTQGDAADEHSKYFQDAPDWTYTHRESEEVLAQQVNARRFRDGPDTVMADATLSWNDGDAMFMIGYLRHKGTLLANFRPAP